MVNDSVATDLYGKVRILCIILTMEKDLHTKTRAVNNTWARRCNKHFFIMSTIIRKPDIITSTYPDERQYLIYKVQSAFEFLHDKYVNDFDWILKADDDTYVIIENLRYLLSHYNASKPGYLGYKFDKFVANGYMSGGGGYVISRQGINQLVENGIRGKKCPIVQTEENPELSEDLLTGECLQNSHVPILNSRDIYGRDTFHPYPVEQHILGELPSYLYSWSKVPPVEVRRQR
ncbi:hypothetical protein CHS0354_032561 [Potamilus streckersoni]|uniref:N-acetylgalactosaminide beta-1,3-galactosyltransferase n=1 Tax=Potamilus streckersoni TaxID=2493646 RepID=A0AAE0VZ44_9BIVA|nr:hypothetical protein CHS0354_032561 [Potamilus streckersoni]